MTASTKDLIAWAREYNIAGVAVPNIVSMADALERLTQPVGVEPLNDYDVATYGAPPVYSAETVARLIAERDEARTDLALLRDYSARADQECCAMQAQVKVLRAAMDKLARLGNEPQFGSSTGNQIAIAALAATEPKGEKE